MLDGDWSSDVCSSDLLLRLMGKPGRDRLEAFLALFQEINRRLPRPRFLTYYFMAAHPGCGLEEMRALRAYAEKNLRLIPEQVQIFTPSPSTWATLMYHTGIDPFSGAPIFVERRLRAKIAQKAVLGGDRPSPARPRRKGAAKL
jgi:radical SAM superfamily enzyme YgiQ (UPF0313 family)